MKTLIRVGTRGSPLALAQTTEVVESLRTQAHRIKFSVVRIQTSGDTMDSGAAVESKSMFSKEIEEGLLNGEIDIAVHSMKDLTTELPDGLIFGAVPQRANAHDALISRQNKKFEQLPAGARIGTSSPRRKAQLLAARGDFEIVDIRGNVDTRLRKLEKGDYDGIVLAAAGLNRLGLEERATEILPTKLMLPAVGQGALAVQSRQEDVEVNQLLKGIDHDVSRRAVEAERAFARRLGADCRTPIAAYARLDGGKLTIEGMVAAQTGRMLVRSRLVSDIGDSEKIGVELAETLLSRGAAAVLEAA